MNYVETTFADKNFEHSHNILLKNNIFIVNITKICNTSFCYTFVLNIHIKV